jgi:hypothetical protein
MKPVFTKTCLHQNLSSPKPVFTKTCLHQNLSSPKTATNLFGGTSTRVLDSSLMTIIYRKITNKNDIEKLQKDLDTLGEWVIENGMKINSGNSKAMRFMTARVENPLGYKKYWKRAVVNPWEQS